MSYCIPGLDATYYTAIQDGRYIVFLEGKALMSYRTKTQAETYAKLHEKLNNKVEGE